MGNYKYYNYKDLEITSSKKPENTHLWWETNSSGIISLIDSEDNKKLYKTTDKGENWSLLDTLDANIRGGWHDYTNNELWLCGDDGSTIYVYKVDLTNDTITEEATSDTWEDVRGYDIFLIGSTYYVIGPMNNVAPGNKYWDLYVYEVNTVTDHLDDLDYIDFGFGYLIGDCSYSIVIGNNAYFLVTVDEETNLIKFDSVAETLSIEEIIADYSSFADRNYGGIAYDGSQYLYFIIKKDADSKNYLMKYEIGGSETVLAEMDMVLMLDRNTDSSADPPFNLEKGFHSTEDKIYQIPEIYNGHLNLISVFDFTDTIVAITDHYVIDNSGNMYEYQDMSEYIIIGKIYHNKEDYPEMVLKTDKNYIQLNENLYTQIIGPYTSYDTYGFLKATYNFKDEVVGASGTDIDFIDSDLSSGSCTITVIEEFDGHKQVLEFNDVDTGYACGRNDFTNRQSGTIEFWMANTDATKTSIFFIRNADVSNICGVRIYGDVFWEYGDGGYAAISGAPTPVDNTWYHLRIDFCLDDSSYEGLVEDTFRIYIDGEEFGDFNCIASIAYANRTHFQTNTSTHQDYIIYIDAIGYSWDSNYTIGDNLEIVDPDPNQVVFEGRVQNYDDDRLQSYTVLGFGVEMDEVKPAGEKSGRTDQIISDINDDTSNNPNYIHDGTLSEGEAMGTISFVGDKKYRKILDHFRDIDGFIWYLKPQGALDYNNGTIDSGVDLKYEDGVDTDKIYGVRTSKQVIKANRVTVRGAIDSSDGTRYEGIYNNIEDQQENGIKEILVVDALLNSDALCVTAATAIGNREEISQTTVNFGFHKSSIGLVQVGQQITFKFISGGESIAQAQFTVDGIVVDIKSEYNNMQISSGITIRHGEYERELPEENSQRIDQNAETVANKPTFSTDTGNPTVNDDIDLGYQIGDLWLNTTDKGLFICCDNADGAADWDEITKA